MTWLRTDDDHGESEIVDALSDKAYRLDFQGRLYAARNLTDGRVPAVRVRRLVPAYKPSALDELLASGLWHSPETMCRRCTAQHGPLDEGYYICGFLDSNPPREKVLQDREEARERMKKKRRSQERSPEHMGEHSQGRSASPTRPDPCGSGSVSGLRQPQAETPPACTGCGVSEVGDNGLCGACSARDWRGEAMSRMRRLVVKTAAGS